MTNFNYFSVNKAYGELYLQFPKVFLYSSKYKELSDSAKIAYMVFKDRLQYSIQNNWIDKNNNVYFIYTNQELQSLLNCSEHKVIKIKKELTTNNLLLQVHQGFNPKKKKNEPNRLYLADLEVEAHEVYAYQNIDKTLDTSGTAKSAVREDKSKTLDTSGTAKSAVRQKESKILDTSGTAKSAVNQYKYIINKDNKDNKDQADVQNQIFNQDFSKPNTTNEQELIEQVIQENDLVLAYGEDTLKAIKVYSFDSLEKFKVYINKFYYGWKSAEKEIGIKINPYEQEALHAELNSTFKRTILQYKQGQVNNINNYLFTAIKNVFIDFGTSIKVTNQKLPKVPLDSWLNK